MITTELKEAIRPRQRILNTIWGAFMAATFIYVFIVWFATRASAAARADAAASTLDTNLVTAVLAVLAVLLAAGSFVYPRYAFTPGRLAQAPAPGPANAKTGGPTELETKAAASLPQSERVLLQYLPAYQSALIVLWAMREAIAILGVVLAILTRNFTIALPFAAAALVLVFMARPRAAEFIDGMKNRKT